jgi:hypothetical protein
MVKENSKKNEKTEKLGKEREEALMRIIVGIVSGIILYFWGYAVIIVAAVNFIYTLISGKRIRELADFTEIWATQVYYFTRYMGFVSNKRPFPFVELDKNIGKVE